MNSDKSDITEIDTEYIDTMYPIYSLIMQIAIGIVIICWIKYPLISLITSVIGAIVFCSVLHISGKLASRNKLSR